MKAKPNLPESFSKSTFTIEDAFDWMEKPEGEDRESEQRDFDSERGVRAVAYLLSDISEGGNEDVPGNVALGLAEALRRYAAQFSRRQGGAR